MGDKKTVYTVPIYFGDHCHIGDETLRCQHLQDTDRTAAAVTQVAVTPRCDDQRCSYWTPVNSPPDEPAGDGDEKIVKSELGGVTRAGPAKNELSGGTQTGPAKSELAGGTQTGPANPMGPLNIMAAIIPFQSSWPTADVDQLSSGSEGSIEFHFNDDDDEWV